MNRTGSGMLGGLGMSGSLYGGAGLYSTGGGLGMMGNQPQQQQLQQQQQNLTGAANNAAGGGGGDNAADSVILEEEFDPNYEPTEDEIIEYAQFLQMDLTNDTDLFWIAREGLKAPLPAPWKPCRTDTNEVYYFNFENGSQLKHQQQSIPAYIKTTSYKDD
jgi:hypothetical protein